ncbi:MAG: hypothetical protein ACRDMA_16660 [Solirubrobacterales bacterium]
MESSDLIEQARVQAHADAELIALRAQVHPRAVVSREVRPMNRGHGDFKPRQPGVATSAADVRGRPGAPPPFAAGDRRST